MKGQGGREDTSGKSSLKESPRTWRRWCLSQEADSVPNPSAPPTLCSAQTLGEPVILLEGKQKGVIH